EHLMELIVWNAHGVPLAKLGSVFDARHADVEVAALDRGLDRAPRHLHESRLAPQPVRDHSRDLDVEPTNPRWIRRVGLDERRAALGVAAPSEHLCPGVRRGGPTSTRRQQRERQRCRLNASHADADDRTRRYRALVKTSAPNATNPSWPAYPRWGSPKMSSMLLSIE